MNKNLILNNQHVLKMWDAPASNFGLNTNTQFYKLNPNDILKFTLKNKEKETIFTAFDNM